MKKLLIVLLLGLVWNTTYSQGFEAEYDPVACQLNIFFDDDKGNVYLKYNFNGSGLRYTNTGQWTVNIFDNETTLSLSDGQMCCEQDVDYVISLVKLAQANCQPF